MLIIQKFGGTSVGSIELIKNVASIVSSSVRSGNKIVVVVSAMSGVTNSLISLCHDISDIKMPDNRKEYDNLISTGEVVTSSLLAIALQDMGFKARSFQSWQIPIISDSNHSNALIENINIEILEQNIKDGIIPVITGFQAISKDNRLTTLGRGGSDTTAVAIASALKADICDIYTDVEGVYTSDPRLINNAKIIESISYDEMIELSAMGAKILHSRSVELAKKYNIPIRIVSTFTLNSGTKIINNINKKNMINEKTDVTGITYTKRLTKFEINLKKLDLYKLYELLDEKKINIFYTENPAKNIVNFFVTGEFKERLAIILEEIQKNNFLSFKTNSDIGIVSIIGNSVSKNNNLISNIIKILEKNEFFYSLGLSAETKICIIVNEIEIEKIVKLLHEKIL